MSSPTATAWRHAKWARHWASIRKRWPRFPPPLPAGNFATRMMHSTAAFAMQDMPRHLGQHSGGMVICQGQLDSVVPLEPASMPGRVVVQWDKEDCADMG